MQVSRRLIIAPVFAGLLLIAFTSPAFAECPAGSLPRHADDPLIVSAAFLATVTEASTDVDSNPDGSAYDLHLVLAVEATYVGSVPKTLVLNEWDSGACGDFKGVALRTGDRIIVAAEELEYNRGAPLGGHMVVWKETAGGWTFFSDALVYGAEPDAYPNVARNADTKVEILAAISAGALPATSTEVDASEPAKHHRTIGLGIAFAAAFALAWHVLASRRRSTPLT